jgi:hypothetical protein
LFDWGYKVTGESRLWKSIADFIVNCFVNFCQYIAMIKLFARVKNSNYRSQLDLGLKPGSIIQSYWNSGKYFNLNILGFLQDLSEIMHAIQ